MECCCWQDLNVIGQFQKISTHPMDDTELGTHKFYDFQEGQKQFIQDSKSANSESWGIPEFCKILNGFPGIPEKFSNFWGNS